MKSSAYKIHPAPMTADRFTVDFIREMHDWREQGRLMDFVECSLYSQPPLCLSAVLLADDLDRRAEFAQAVLRRARLRSLTHTELVASVLSLNPHDVLAALVEVSHARIAKIG